MSKKVNKKEITYSRNGDYLVPDLVVDNGKLRPKLGKYGRLRLKFLKEEMKAEFTFLFEENTEPEKKPDNESKPDNEKKEESNSNTPNQENQEEQKN